MEGEQSPSSVRYVSDDRHVTSEQAALAEMAYRLGSSNVVGEHEDDGSTRREAKLLMSLSALPQSPNQADLELISSSESDSSYMSDSSRSAEAFTFICPALSLENSPGSALQHAYREKRNLVRRSEDAELSPTPALLLGRQLKADDRDAVRLSADAMARNVYDSFRKALQWRATAWIEALSKSIASKEKALIAKGATKEQLKSLLSSSEAKLIVALRNIEDRIKVSSTRTSFTVLPQRVEKNGEPVSKKRRALMPRRPSLEEGEYQYSVAHVLRFVCVVELYTPAGFAEVTLEVPGTMDGTFLSMGYDQEQMTAVSIDINTEMLASMVEKCCRKIVRASLECELNSTQSHSEPEEESTQPPKVTFAPSVHDSPKVIAARTLIHDFTTPPPAQVDFTITPDTVRAALVSPNHLAAKSSGSRSRFLSPIPDDFDSISPRRISPQPRSVSEFKSSFSPFTTPHTPKVHFTGAPSSVLVSPQPLTTQTNMDFFTLSKDEQGPSLPLLVEVACRAYRDN